jgi:hypothetical protein
VCEDGEGDNSGCARENSEGSLAKVDKDKNNVHQDQNECMESSRKAHEDLSAENENTNALELQSGVVSLSRGVNTGDVEQESESKSQKEDHAASTETNLSSGASQEIDSSLQSMDSEDKSKQPAAAENYMPKSDRECESKCDSTTDNSNSDSAYGSKHDLTTDHGTRTSSDTTSTDNAHDLPTCKITSTSSDATSPRNAHEPDSSYQHHTGSTSSMETDPLEKDVYGKIHEEQKLHEAVPNICEQNLALETKAVESVVDVHSVVYEKESLGDQGKKSGADDSVSLRNGGEGVLDADSVQQEKESVSNDRNAGMAHEGSQIVDLDSCVNSTGVETGSPSAGQTVLDSVGNKDVSHLQEASGVLSADINQESRDSVQVPAESKQIHVPPDSACSNQMSRDSVQVPAESKQIHVPPDSACSNQMSRDSAHTESLDHKEETALVVSHDSADSDQTSRGFPEPDNRDTNLDQKEESVLDEDRKSEKKRLASERECEEETECVDEGNKRRLI